MKDKKNILINCVEVILFIALLITSIYVVPTFVVQRTIVDGDSMLNNYYDGENLLADKCSHRSSHPERFDVIVFYPHGRTQGDDFVSFVKSRMGRQNKDDYYIKRVIGLPGEKVQIKGADIYINDKKLKENYGKMKITYSGLAQAPVYLGKDEYFVLGDNRQISEDSRYFGAVKRKNIGGRILFRIPWPKKSKTK